MNEKNTVVSDQKLIEQYKNGDTLAFNTLIKRHSPALKEYIGIHINDKDIMNDILQLVLIKTYEALLSDAYKDQNKFFPWIKTVTKNQVIDYFRQEKRSRKYTVDIDHPDILNQISVMSHEDELILEQNKVEVQKCIQKLPNEQIDVVIMRIYGGILFKDIAKATDAKLVTAVTRMRYAKKNLSKLLHQEQLLFK